MTEIALRTYNQEIKDLTDHGRFDEAIAHCQHILETFPRHIETYRLLGKAFLEQGRHGDAADVFQRVLSAVPEDWLAHVAMAIVREDESNLDMAIWHMERAYEVNPSNPTVQQEVRRLRGRRDGVEPPKLRLTRSALARMYIKGGLYGQAIAEIRSALSEDPDRPDLQTILASALFDSGAIQEAADICNALLQKLPYCMEANRTLGLVLWTSEKKEDAEKLFQRMESLDPYIDTDTLKKEKRIAEHPAQSITLSRLEYEGQEKTVRTKQPSWASSLGLKIEESQPRQAVPDWLANASQQPPAFQGTPQSAAPAGPTGEVPSWINEAAAVMGPTSGVAGPSSGFPTPPVRAAAEPSIARTATGELPDWIQAQAMPAEQPKQERPSGPLPDWLSAPSTPPPSAPSTTATGNPLPDWIKTSSLPPETPKEQITGIPDWLSTPPPPSIEALPYSSLPESIRPETKTGPLEVEPGNIPDWLNSSQPATPDLGPEPVWLKQPASAKPISESVPEWMKGVSPVESQLPAGPDATTAPDWLREAPAAPSKPVESVPDWMRSETPPSAAPAPEKSFPQMTLSDDIPEWMKPEPETSTEPPSTPVLGARAPVESVKSEPPPPSDDIPEINFPDWMTSPPAEPTSLPAPSAENLPEAVPEVNLPDWLNAPPPQAQPMEASAPPIPADVPEVILPDWLKPPEASPVAALEQAPQPAIPATFEAPQDAVDLTTEEAPAESIPEIDLPDWLKAVPAPAAPPAPAPSSRIKGAAEPSAEPVSEAELPDWLRGGSVQAPTQAMPTPAERISEPAPSAPPEPPPAAVEPIAVPAQPIPEMPQPVVASEPGPTHVTPTTTEGIDLPEWLVDQLQGKPKETSTVPAAEATSTPLPDWLKPTPNKSAAAPVLDWDKAASQPLPTLPVDATRPATGLSSASDEKPAGGSTEIPSWLDKSKPTGSDTVARWLDRRLKTSTLSSLDESALKGAAKGPSAAAPGRPGTGSTQLPTWLDTQKPGGSDTVVRWMDKRETGSLRKPVTATFSSISKAAVPPPSEQIPSSPIAASPKSAEGVAAPGGEDTVTSRRTALPIPVERAPIAPAPIPAASSPIEPRIPPRPSAVVAPPVKPPTTPLVTAAAPVEEEEEGAFVPPPEWLQKALGNAVAEVPPIPRKQTGSLTPGTVSPKIPIAEPEPPVAVKAEPVPVEEAAPAPAVRPGSWIPLATPPAAPAVQVQKTPRKSVRKKTRRLTDVESEAIIREARVYLETDLQKATAAYQQVIDDPASAEVVVGDLTTYLEQDPGSPLLWNLLGDACSKAGRLQDAYRAYAEALRRM